MKAKRVAKEKGLPETPNVMEDPDKMTEMELVDYAQRLIAETARMQEELNRMLAEESIRYYVPNRAQAKFHYARNDRGEIARNRVLQGSNKVGKTFGGVYEDVASALGYRPWLEPSDPNYKVDIVIPNLGLIMGETLTTSVDKKLVPDLKKAIPVRCFGMRGWDGCTKKNPQGVVTKIIIPFGINGEKCGSEIHLGSYDQRSDIQEGLDWGWVHYDEPPPHDVYIAIERGKISGDSRSWMTMTPLKEAWILDDLVEKAEIDSDYQVVFGKIWENLNGWWCESCNWCANPEEVEGDVKCPQCGQLIIRVFGALKKEAIDDFIKKCDSDEFDARILGQYKHLSGLIYRGYLNRDDHVVEDFDMGPCIKAGWTPYEAVDPHDNRPTCWLFGAISPDERMYEYTYLLTGGSVGDIVKAVKVQRVMFNYQEPRWVVLDKKHGQKENAALADGMSWQKSLEKEGIKNIILSQSSAGDVELGHKEVKNWLKKQFSPLRNKEIPRLMFFKKGCGGEGGPIYQMFRYSYGDLGDKAEKNPSAKPKDLYKDFPDTVRYMIMAGPRYIDPQKLKANKEALKRRMDEMIGVRRRMYGNDYQPQEGRI